MEMRKQYRFTLNFPSKQEYDVFNNFVRTQAGRTTGYTGSSWVISDVLDRYGLLDDDLLTKWTIVPLYRGDKSIRDVLDGEFGENAAGVDLQALHTNYLPLVEYASRISRHWNLRVSGTADDRHHFLSCFRSVVEKVSTELGNEPDVYYGISNAGDYGKALVNEFDRPEQVPTGNAVDYVLSNWNMLNNYTFTFRMLSSLMRCSIGWRDVERDANGYVKELHFDRDACERRDELVAILRGIRAEW